MGVDSINRDLQYLTGPEAAGRLSGSQGAKVASDYLAAALNEFGLSPAGEDGYFQWVDVPAARITGQGRLTVGGVAYRYRREFGEMTHLSAGGTIRAPLVVVYDGEEVRPEKLVGKVILIPKRPEGLDVNATAAAAAEIGAAALLVEWGEPKWFHKTLFGSADNRIPVVRIREGLAGTLSAQPGAEVELELPLSVGRLPCRNVLGFLPGTNSGVTVALTAHYDHVGDDPGGQRFPGAVDNASGVVTMLEVLRKLREQNIQLPFNLLVGFLTGEESGVWGAKHLAANPPVPLTAVINLDGIGREPALRAIRLGYPTPGNWLADLAAELYRERGTEIQWTAGGDDAVAFQAAGLPALGLGQMPTEPSLAGIHSPDDTVEVVHLPVIEEGAMTIISLLHRLADHTALAPYQVTR